MSNNKDGRWGFAQVWNNSLAGTGRGGRDARDHLWASDLGKAPIDVYLKLQGVDPSNPPNARSRRKFEAGHLWEWVVEMILKRAGILKDTQEWVSHEYDGLLEVTGKLDFLAGGEPHYGEVDLEEMGLPDKFVKAGKKITNYLQEEYPNGLDTRVIELKSTSSFMFEKIAKNDEASKNHELQLFHYLKAKDMKRGMVVYVCKDDCRMIEIPVYNPSSIEQDYKGFIKKMTEYYRNNERPPKQKPIVYDERFDKFSKNWQVEYSDYLTKIYGFEKPKEFYDKYSKIAKSWNRVLTRMRKGKDMTDNNKRKIKQMKEMGFDPDKLA